MVQMCRNKNRKSVDKQEKKLILCQQKIRYEDSVQDPKTVISLES